MIRKAKAEGAPRRLDPEEYLRRRAATVRRGTAASIAISSTILALALWGLVAVSDEGIVCLEHPGWIGQVAEDEVSRSIPGWVDEASESALERIGEIGERLEKEALGAIPRIRRNAARDAARRTARMSEHIDEHLEEIVSGIVAEHRDDVAPLLAGQGRALEDAFAKAAAKRIPSIPAKASAWDSGHVLEAVATKLAELETAEEPTAEEVLEREIVVVAVEILLGAEAPGETPGPDAGP